MGSQWNAERRVSPRQVLTHVTVSFGTLSRIAAGTLSGWCSSSCWQLIERWAFTALGLSYNTASRYPAQLGLLNSLDPIDKDRFVGQ